MNFVVFYTGALFPGDDVELNTVQFDTITEAWEFYHLIQIYDLESTANPTILDNNTGRVFNDGRWY